VESVPFGSHGRRRDHVYATRGARTVEFSASINWGDPANTTTAGEIVPLGGGRFEVRETTHAYPRANTYNVQVTVTLAPSIQPYAGGTTSFATPQPIPLTVRDVPVTAAGLTFAPDRGQPYTGSVATITDGNPLARASDFTNLRIQWGDGPDDSIGLGRAIATAGRRHLLGFGSGRAYLPPATP
jgi:hypothetical protein